MLRRQPPRCQYETGALRSRSGCETCRGAVGVAENSLLQHAFLENDRNVWLSTSKGVWRYDLLTGESLCLRNDEMDMFSLSNDYTTCTFVDKDGGLWVGTKDAGVNYSGPSQNNFEKQYLADGESLENVLVSGFAEDEAGADLGSHGGEGAAGLRSAGTPDLEIPA